MALGEGLPDDTDPEVSSVFLLIGMLAVGGGVVKEEESAERASEAARGGTRFGREFELALSFALRLENRSMEGVFFRGCLVAESAACFLSCSKTICIC